MPKLPRTTYRAELTNSADPDNPTIVELTPILADLLRAELEGPKHGLRDPSVHSLHFTVMWLWSAALRAGAFEGGFPEFKAALVNFEPVKAVDAQVQGVPPTPAAGDTEPHSPLPHTSGTPTTPGIGYVSSRETPMTSSS